MFVTTLLIDRLVDPVRRWPIESQLRARRNAMIASTALAQRRAEIEAVEEFLAARRRPRTPEGRAAHG
jgi:hypothetical protein